MSRILSVDPGTVRVGLAVSDPLGISVRPLEVVAEPAALERIVSLCSEMDLEEVIVGLPVREDGREAEGAASARNLASQIAARTGLKVTTVDERYTTRMAEEMMAEAGKDSRARRGKVDGAAAAVLLRGYLDRSGRAG
ncbi:MAG: Holliday junction resolvase RuvX [Actinomycetota bacterium]